MGYGQRNYMLWMEIQKSFYKTHDDNDSVIVSFKVMNGYNPFI